MPHPAYVLVTAVRNEADVVGETLASMRDQTVPPAEWVIVSDGSTDGTDALVQAAAQASPWIKLLQLPPRTQACLAARIKAIQQGLGQLQCRDYAFIGALDGDLRFATNYYERVLAAFAQNPRLGIAGGRVVDVGMDRTRLPRNRQDVPGGVQLFRRECFEAQGGYLELPEGGSDTVACARARMLGYETRLLTELVVDHLKPRNVWAGGLFRRKWQLGVREYALGNHPLFELLKCLGRVSEPPWLVGALCRWTGYLGCALRRLPRPVPADVVAHIRREQLARLKPGGRTRSIPAGG